MNSDSRTRRRVLAISGVVLVVVVAVLVIVLVSGGSPKTTTAGTSADTTASPGTLVIAPVDAKGLGFATTVQKAKKTPVKDQKGCTDSVEAVYEDSASKTGLVSDVLICQSTAAASTALATARKEVTVDSSLQTPPGLGSEAFATASNAPEYLMVWRAGTKVAITAIDLDVNASSTSTTVASPPPLTAAQEATLKQAALHQNSLY
jgi:hypothetical protein